MKFFLIKNNDKIDVGTVISSYKNYHYIGVKGKTSEIQCDSTDERFRDYSQLETFYENNKIILNKNELVSALVKIWTNPGETPSLEKLADSLKVNRDFLKLKLGNLGLIYSNLCILAQEKKINPFDRISIRWKKYFSVLSDHAQKRLIERFGLDKEDVKDISFVLEKWLSSSVEVSKVKMQKKKELAKHGENARYVVNFKEKIVFVMTKDLKTIMTIYDASEASWLDTHLEIISSLD